MENTNNSNEICLRVFARASASISHEIKNTLSIINENAGLLDDLAGMTEEGGGVPPARVQSAVSSIMKQVVRSNMIMKNLNQFAHSADSFLAQADLAETLSLTVALTARQAAMKKTTVSNACPPGLSLHTYLFPLESLLYLILCRLCGRMPSEGGTLAIHASEDNSSIIIDMQVEKQESLLLEKTPDDERILAELIGVTCRYEDTKLIISFPAAINHR
jgi:hypothetical protein